MCTHSGGGQKTICFPACMLLNGTTDRNLKKKISFPTKGCLSSVFPAYVKQGSIQVKNTVHAMVVRGYILWDSRFTCAFVFCRCLLVWGITHGFLFISRFLSRDQRPYWFDETKESICIKIEFNSQ